MKCRKCGSEKLGVTTNKKNPNATDLYCLECGAWQKFATKDEIRLYQTRKQIVRTNADYIRSMDDEELARFLASVENRRSAAGNGAKWCGAANALEWLRQERNY